MRIILDPETGDNFQQLAASGHISQSSAIEIVRLVGAYYDTINPKQDRDPQTGELLWIDANGNVMTQSAVNAANRPSPGPGPSLPSEPIVTTPKYVSRTPQEVWAKIGASATKALLDQYVRLAQEEAQRYAPSTDRPVVTPVYPPVIV